MIGKKTLQNQRNLFDPQLSDIIDKNHELALLADTIQWDTLEKSLAKYYSNVGQPSMPIRFMVGCMLLKHLFNLGDESLAKTWIRDAYMQYFTGEGQFKHHFPCDPSDFVHFRKRIGAEGMELIFTHTVLLHGKKAKSKTVLSDTTVQENNVTFPTDAKLLKKVIDGCHKIFRETGIKQCQSYKRISKVLVRNTYNSSHPKRRKQALASQRKLRTITGRVLRELGRKLSQEALSKYEEDLSLYHKVLTQKKYDKDKIYSLHKPYTSCIAKGKAHKKYEFGNKIGLVVNPKSLLVLGIASSAGNPHDSKTIAPLLSQMERTLSYQPEEVIYDRGGRGISEINGVKIQTPKRPNKTDSRYERMKKRKKFRRRAAIEPVIGHLKKYFRMGENYLKGSISPQINAFLAASAWNLKKLMQKLVKKREEVIFVFILELKNGAIFYKKNLNIRLLFLS